MKKLQALVVLALLATLVVASSPASAQGGSHYFPKTGHTVKGRFLQYWQQHGGLAQQGYPISDELQERSDTDGKVYTVQYFERAMFEYHAENQPPNDVLLSLLGNFRYKLMYPNGAPGQTVNSSAGSIYFPQTGHRLGGVFLGYWQRHGGLMQQGYPISNEFQEAGTDGITRTVQYFERAVFELHPENVGTPYEVLLTQLGTLRYHAPLPNKFLYSITMVSPTEGWAVGESGIILHYTGGGWRQVASPVQEGSLFSISMDSAEDGWAVGHSNVLHYINGVWQDASNTFPRLANPLPPPNRKGLISVDMVSPDTGWMIADGGILRYSNGQWGFDYFYDNPRMTGPILANIKMVSASEGWTVGSSAVLHYQNGSWGVSYPNSEHPSIGVVDFGIVSSNDVWTVGIGGFLHYDGSTWNKVASSISTLLLSVYMTSATDGWTVGEAGTILHYNGSAWQQVPSPTDKYLEAVQMVSSIEGWAVGEAGTILHYQNGTWSVYQQ